MTIAEVADLARKLAKTGLVIDAKGIPGINALADDDVDLDARILRHDVERRHRVFTRVLQSINSGLESLPDKGSPRRSVDSAIEEINSFFGKGKRLYEAISDSLFLREIDLDNFEQTDPNGSYAAEDRHALERIGVTYINATRVAYDYDLVKNAVPWTGKHKKIWKSLMEAKKEGILYGHKWTPSKKAHDFPLIDDGTIRKLEKGRQVYLISEAYQKLADLSDAIPAMRNREERKKELASGTRYWIIGDRFSAELYEGLGNRYWLLLNGFGSGKWHKSSHRPYFEPAPNFTDSMPMDGPKQTRNLLERVTGNAKDVFRAEDYLFKGLSIAPLVNQAYEEKLINDYQRKQLEKDSEEFVKEANNALNACRS